MEDKEKKWLKEGIDWKTHRVWFALGKDGKLFCHREQIVSVDLDPIEFLKKIGLVEDGITQEDINKVFKEAFGD